MVCLLRVDVLTADLETTQQGGDTAGRCLLLHLKMHKSKHANTFIEHRIYLFPQMKLCFTWGKIIFKITFMC